MTCVISEMSARGPDCFSKAREPNLAQGSPQAGTLKLVHWFSWLTTNTWNPVDSKLVGPTKLELVVVLIIKLKSSPDKGGKAPKEGEGREKE